MTDELDTISASDEMSDSDTTGLAPVGDDAAAPARKSSRRVTLAIVAVLVLGALAFGGLRANAVWGRHAMMVTGATAAQALVEGRAEELAAVSNAEVRSGLATATVETMRMQGVLGEFSAVAWSGDDGIIAVSTGMGEGKIILAPAADADVVTFRTSGAIGMASGALSMQRMWSGWVVSGLMVAPISKPASHPSALPTETTTP